MNDGPGDGGLLNKEISSGDLLARRLRDDDDTTSFATTDNTTFERPVPVPQQSLAAGLLALSAMPGHCCSAEPGAEHGEQDGSGRAMDVLQNSETVATLTSLRPESTSPSRHRTPTSSSRFHPAFVLSHPRLR